MANQRELVERLFEAALTLSPLERKAFLDKKCGSNLELRQKIENLLVEETRAGSFLEHPPFDSTYESESDPQADETTRPIVNDEVRQSDSSVGRLRPGEVLKGRFEVLRYLNRGGMGEVYEAWDSDLREFVALKTIRSEMMSDALIVDYFKEEVKQARQIAHPNVCRVYDLYGHGDYPAERIWFLTMQLLQGCTLSDQLREKGPLPTELALGLIVQLVSGLAAAHEVGVVHRDFKSANIMLVPTPGGNQRAVITDFGLARRITRGAPTTLGPGGEGTPVYVAPEQWRDGVAGPSADQYALGVVICEMITGKCPIPARVDAPEPSQAQLPADPKLEDRWERVIRRCLEVKPENRFGSVNEILPALTPRRPLTTPRWLVTVIGFPILAAVGVLAVIYMNRSQSSPFQTARAITAAESLSTNPSLSHNGKLIAYSSNQGNDNHIHIYVQPAPFDSGTAKKITQDPAADDDEPSLSPDGQKVVFSSERTQPGIYVSDATGGGDRLLAKNGRGPRFSPDNKSIVYWKGDDNMEMPSGSIYFKDLVGGSEVPLLREFADAREPIWNSDGQHILFRGCRNKSDPFPECLDWWVTTVKSEDKPELVFTGAKQSLDERGIRQIGDFGGWYGDTVLFSAAHGDVVHLWELSISPKTWKVKGQPLELTDDARVKVTSSSQGGNVLAFTDLSTEFQIWRIDAIDPSHPAEQVTYDAELDENPYVSQNGHWLTFIRGFEDRGLWVRYMGPGKDAGKETLLPATQPNKFSPVISEDGSSVAYEAREKIKPTDKNSTSEIFLLTGLGGKPYTYRICEKCRNPTGWFDDEAGLLYSDVHMKDILMYSLSDHQPRKLLSSSNPNEYLAEASWSPTNQYLLFTLTVEKSEDAKTRDVNGQVFAIHFPRGAKAPDSDRIQITTDSSNEKPRWSGDGKTIFYLSNRDGHWCLWGRHFDPASGRAVGNPFEVKDYHNPDFTPYTIDSAELNLSVAGNLLYVNVSKNSGKIYVAELRRRK